MKAAIVGIAGLALTPFEAQTLRAHRPVGVILFARNVESPVQLRALTASLRDILPPEAVLMVDQEGGRVARLRPPHWRAHPPAGTIGALYARDPSAGLRAAWITGVLIGLDCAEAGFDVACAPVLDLRIPGAHDVIGDRAYGADPEAVGALGRAVAEGLMQAGIHPVAKHIPGHGRALADSHLELPQVDEPIPDAELRPFQLCAGLPWAMTAHILYTEWDATRPATLSPTVIGQVIRRKIGFNGVLVSDDLTMRALSGDPAELAKASLEAGCDLVLHCSGAPDETADLLARCPAIGEKAAARLDEAWSSVRAWRTALNGEALIGEALAAERDRLLA